MGTSQRIDMKKQKVQTAIQMIRNQDSISALCESIGQRTAQAEQARLESIYEDDEKPFDMDNLLSVKTIDEEDQPRLNLPKEPFEVSPGLKAQIVDELAKLFKRMPGEVVDLENDISPIATVIEDKLGVTQPLGAFIKNLISGAADHQNSQQFAKGTPVPGLQDVASAGVEAEPTERKAPTEVAPEMKEVEGSTPEVGMEAPITDLSIDSVDVVPPTAPVANVVPEAELPIDAPVADLPAEPVAPDVASDVTAAIDDTEVPTTVDDIDLDFDKTPATDVEHAEHEASETPAEEKVEEEAKEEAKEDGELPDEDKDLGAQLEAISSEFNATKRAAKVNAMVEGIVKGRSGLETQLEGISAKFAGQSSDATRGKELTAKLESIIADVKKQKDVSAKLEGIVARVNGKPLTESAKCDCGNCPECTKGKIVAPITGKLPAEEKIEKTVTPDAQLEAAKLAALVDGYKGSKKPRMEAIDNRAKARAAIASLTK